MKLSANFSLAEAIKSQTAVRNGIDNTPSASEIEALKKVAENILQPVRDHYGKPFSPSSWYRCADLCVAIGSKTTSQHAKGQAADFEVPGVPNIELARWIEANLDFDQLILEHYSPNDPAAGWIHCSYVGPGQNRKNVLKYDGNSYTPSLPS